MTRPKVSIIVISYNTKTLLRRCLSSIKRNLKLSKSSCLIEVIIIDNASKDGSAQMVKKEFPQFKLIINKTNKGFAKAVNQGIKSSKGEYIFLLNSDVFVKSDSLEKMLEFISCHSGAGIVGPQLVNPDGTIQSSVYHYPGIINAIKEYWFGQKNAFGKYSPAGLLPVAVDSIVGAAMLMPRSVVEKVGLFDERYQMYFEDIDFCLRVRKAGLKVYYLPAVQLTHCHGASAQKIPAQTLVWLKESSKIFHGVRKYYLLTYILWAGQKWQKLVGKK